MRRAVPPWFWLALSVPACNALLGIEEGTPRRVAPPDSDGGRASDGGGSNPAGAGAAAGVSTGGGEKGGAEQGGAMMSGASGDGAAGQPSTCDSAGWPRPPERNSAGTASDVELIFAAKTLHMSDGASIGRDIDQSCTCPDAPTCKPGGNNPELACDEIGGRDVVGNELLGAVAAQQLPDFSEPALQKEVARGRAGLVLRIRGYNGLPDDKRVNVEVFGKVWIPNAATSPLRHDGTDVWTPYDDLIVAETSVQQDINAYVRDYVLVANLAQLSVALRPDIGNNDNSFLIELKDTVLSGKLVPMGSTFAFEAGNAAGRWPTAEALYAFRVLEYPDGSSICGDQNPLYGFLRASTCDNADVMAERARDNTSSDCDGISFAIGFDAEPADLAKTTQTPLQVAPNCPKDWRPTCFD
jgi:hypothetical protein